jgi:beta-glucosidase
MKRGIFNLLLFVIFNLIIIFRLNAQDIKYETSGKLPEYLNTNLSFEERAKILVKSMTLDEKILQMNHDALPIPRLGIPYYNWSGECLHGIANEGGFATVFPQAIGMAATWDPDLIRKEADVIATEARAWYYLCIQKNNTIGVHKAITFWSPNINIFRDPRWGRGQETYGEDPYLTSQIGVAFVKGLQGNDPKYFKVISTPKHYAVHSGPESLRHKFNAVINERDLYETYLPAFEACIREGKAYSVMGAYSGYSGIPCCANNFLLDDVLRKKWGFTGYVVSDCGAITDIYNNHKFAQDEAKASALSVKAGCDITCGTEYTSLKEAVKKGYIKETEIDTAVFRLMFARMKLGMFDPPEMVPYAGIPVTALELNEHRTFSLEVARKSIVLLKNENNLLPLDKQKIKSIAVIGPYISREDVLYGNYNGISSKPVTFLEGIRKKLGKDVKIQFTKGIIPHDEGGALMTIPSGFLKPPDGNGKGLLGEYFANPDVSGKPVFTKVDTNMVQYWDINSPGKGIPNDFFSVRWSGYITPPETGNYILGIITDDRGRMYFDGKMVVDNWKPYQMNVMKTYKTKMEKGKQYKICIEYADSVEYAGIRFQWKMDFSDIELEGKDQLYKKAIDITKNSDLAIVYAGISANLEGEEMSVDVEGFKGGDKTSLDLPKDQQQLIKDLKATGKPIIVILTSGSALAVNWENENIPAILHSWYPGEEGGNAVADVIFGDYNPAGRLPVTFYKSVNDIPPFEDYNMKGRTYRYFTGEPLYPFGYGLSYTRFEYSKLFIDKKAINAKDSIIINFDVKNTGNYDGDEVIQLYTKSLASKEPQPVKSLRRFKRIYLKKGESKNILMVLKPEDLKYYYPEKKDYFIEPGRYEIQIGSSSKDIRLKENIEIIP